MIRRTGVAVAIGNNTYCGHGCAPVVTGNGVRAPVQLDLASTMPIQSVVAVLQVHCVVWTTLLQYKPADPRRCGAVAGLFGGVVPSAGIAVSRPSRIRSMSLESCSPSVGRRSACAWSAGFTT